MEQLMYDDSDWTDEERAELAIQAGWAIGWDAMDEYDDYDQNKK